MGAALIAIWEFLVLLGPLLISIGTTLVEIWRAVVEVGKVTAILTLIWGIFEILFDPKGKQRVGNLLANLVGGAITVAQPLLTAGETELAAIVHAFAQSFKNTGPALAGAVVPDIQDFVKSNLSAIDTQLKSIGESTPANATDTASIAMGEAFGLGIGSAVTAAAFEGVLPERLNTLNGIAPMLAELAGFKEVTKNVLEPLYANAFGRSLEYQYRAQFKPELPDEADAVTWHARRLITDGQLRTLFGFSGLKSEYETPFIEGAYRAFQPRALATLFQDVDFNTPQMKQLLDFAGIRDSDQAILLPALKLASTKNVRQQYITSAVHSTELGVMTPAELETELTQAGYGVEARGWVQLTVSTRKLEQLAELFRKSVSEAYRYGTITDPQYVPSLEAIGIGQADAEAHYAVDSTIKHGKDLLAAQRAAARLAAQQMRSEVKAAIESFHQRVIDAAGLSAALLLAGMDPTVAGFTVTYQELRRDGNMVFLYGIELPRDKALALRENVTALEAQSKAQLVTPQQALAALLDYGIPQANALALVADWFASHIAASAVGTLLPR